MNGGLGLSEQSEFDFGAESERDGYAQWLTGRRVAIEALARKMNLPLGHQVEVWLKGNVRLRGVLRLQEEFLLIQEEKVRALALVVDGVPFTGAEIESCVRMD